MKRGPRRLDQNHSPNSLQKQIARMDQKSQHFNIKDFEKNTNFELLFYQQTSEYSDMVRKRISQQQRFLAILGRTTSAFNLCLLSNTVENIGFKFDKHFLLNLIAQQKQ